MGNLAVCVLESSNFVRELAVFVAVRTVCVAELSTCMVEPSTFVAELSTIVLCLAVCVAELSTFVLCFAVFVAELSAGVDGVDAEGKLQPDGSKPPGYGVIKEAYSATVSSSFLLLAPMRATTLLKVNCAFLAGSS